ncbi:MAG: hypothetical protein Q8J64_09290 [Thermodesulfovibrionales bacterium]|nr:hypothetical protein [Thermodesulfovibrionales bacterium]
MEKWYETEEDKVYEEAVKKIKDAVRQGMSFEQAGELIGVEDEKLKESVLDDSLKVLIAEMHLIGRRKLAEVAKALKLPVEKVEKAKKEMLEDIEQSAVDAYKSETGQTGNA